MADQLPQDSLGDDIHRTTRAALSAIPFAGGAAVELFNRLLVPPIQRRRDAWLNALAERLDGLEQDGRVSVEELSNKEEFISTLMQASQAVVRNHQQEKIDALRNAVLNTALGHAPEDSKRELFIGLIDTLTIWHMRVFRILASPPADVDVRRLVLDLSCGARLAVMEVVVRHCPEMSSEPEFLNKVLEDLARDYLVVSDEAFRSIEGDSTMPCITPLGAALLRFITTPEGDT